MLKHISTHQFKSVKAFTLVELSIVIVIIGLIIAGLTAGQSLVKASKTRKLLQDVANYKTAINTFKIQYDAVPGDMVNASQYFSACIDDMSNGNTCNGNNNKLITPINESYRFWQHLALSGLINGSYTGTFTVTDNVTEGVNSPVTPFQGFNLWPKNNTSQYGRPAAAKNNFHYRGVFNGGGGAFTATEAYNIDLKIDDGLADRGWVAAEDTPCVTAAYNVARSYNLSQATAKCRMFFYW